MYCPEGNWLLLFSCFLVPLFAHRPAVRAKNNITSLVIDPRLRGIYRKGMSRNDQPTGQPQMGVAMSQPNELIDRYFAVWNERDAARRQELIAQTWAEDASYLDPLMQGEGHRGIDSMVHNVQQQFAVHRFRRLGGVDGHHDRLRYQMPVRSSWAAPILGLSRPMGGCKASPVS